MSSKKTHEGQRRTLLTGASLFAAAAAALSATPAMAQDADEEEAIVVTGTRIQRQDFTASSPVTTVSQEQIVANADVTLDTFLNTLPGVNPAGTTTSNNPGNGGQSNVDLRGLGANRNLVLIDGRRAMVSASNQTVDINTIPQAMVSNVEVITGGAGAVYGADAVAGAVNFRLRDDFEGLDFRGTYSNSTEYWDAEEYNLSGVVGANFDGGRGNFSIGLERSVREGMIKSQRDFAAVATSTTSFLPEGNFFFSGTNAPSEAVFDAIFAGYGFADPNGQTLGSGRVGFNLDGTMFAVGTFNSPLDVVNFDYPIDNAVNTNLYPDVYSYNFDAVNILTLPLERTSFLGRFNYEFDNEIEVYGRVGWAEYSSATALAPTPFPTVNGRAPGNTTTNNQYTSPLISVGSQINALMVIPVTNPFIPADLATLLASRAGDNPALVGSGATEPFTFRQRTLDVGLRQSNVENTVVQFMFGFQGPIGDSGWDFDTSLFHGITEIDQNQTGNVDTQRIQTLLEAADGGVSICAGGLNVFGRQPLSAECVEYLEVQSGLTTEFILDVFQAYVSGDLAQLPAGPIQAVFGAEYRAFEYNLDPGSAGGPISGFNAQNPAGGENSFTDLFAEALVPLAEGLDLTLGYRVSRSEFADTVNGISGDARNDPTYKAELTWEATNSVLLRASYQHAVRAPNFGELFDGGGSAPQYFDPCSAQTTQLNGPDAVAMAALCTATGLVGVGTYVQTPGSQASLTTAGNTNLNPEEADTYTIGAVFISPWADVDLRASIDYYNIAIDGPIIAPGVNQVTAACYNYYGGNPTYSAAYGPCTGIVRFGGDILGYSGPNPDGTYPGENGGSIETSGIDIQVDYGVELGAGNLRFNLLMNHILEWAQADADYLPALDYAGTVSFFGEGLGTSFPEFKATLNSSYEIGDFTFNMRNRFIQAMDNRAAVIFPGEEFTGTPDVWYTDLSATWQVTDNASVRLGVNNVADEQPPTYAPNVQSGTDPSLFDVVGRRAFMQLNLRY